LIEFIENNALMTYFQQKFPQESTILGIFESLKFGTNYIIKSNSLHASIFILYFTFLYRWFFNWKISNSQALVGTLTFVGAIFLGKLLFYSYFAYLRTNLVASYGDYYTAVVALLWIFQVMCFFFFGACLCHVLELRPLKMIPSSLLAKEVGESSKSDEVRKND
jgi:membrane protein